MIFEKPVSKHPTLWSESYIIDTNGIEKMKKEEVFVKDLTGEAKMIAEYIQQYNQYTENIKTRSKSGNLYYNSYYMLRCKMQRASDSHKIGRLSCPWVIMDKGCKSQIQIAYNGNYEPIREIDLSSFYPTLFYAETGIDIREGYEPIIKFLKSRFPKWKDSNKYKRKSAKKIMNAILVASTPQKASAAIQNEINFLDIEKCANRAGAAKTLLAHIYTMFPGLKNATDNVRWASVMNQHESILMSKIGDKLMELEIPFLHCYDAMYIPESLHDECNHSYK